ncbi:hypothetical protein QJS10_CPB18g00821 [Acorus calamus]|uniref:Reverse transcriptase domain-containing protein n=1 Tax=Acorus calamus TaxID=4465 RepID=A0AAV9CLT5_ACOCL|nr:hypothetical protein QJS10_CPB18g00821 [Acorus calamus]
MHDPLNHGLLEEEARERRRYVQSIHSEDEVMRQKARLNWLQNGDRCTKIFYAQFAVWKSNSTLKKVVLSYGEEVLDKRQVQHHTVEFYKKNLLNKESFQPIPPIYSSKKLSDEHKDSLYVAITEDEIYLTLKSMHAHEMVKYLSMKNGKGRATIKIDLRKAFDSIGWPFIQAVLEAMNFSSTWVQWIMECIQSPRFSFAFRDWHGDHIT